MRIRIVSNTIVCVGGFLSGSGFTHEKPRRVRAGLVVAWGQKREGPIFRQGPPNTTTMQACYRQRMVGYHLW